MSPSQARLAVVTALVLLSGCHAKFKREAGSLGSVRTQIVNTGGPYVELGKVGNPVDDGNDRHDSTAEAIGAIAALAVNIHQEVQGAKLADRIAKAVDPKAVNNAFNDGIRQTLQDGPPFAYTDDKDAAGATMQIEVLSYGLDVPYLGAPGQFTYDLRVNIYKKDGERVYKVRHSCAVGAGTPDISDVVLGVVNNVEGINEMSDADLNSAFTTMAAYCAETFVVRMRRHAG